MSGNSDKMRAHLMLVDDEPNILKALQRVFVTKGYELEMFTDPAEALACAKQTRFDLVLSDYRMPEVDGVSFLTIFRTLQPDAARLILSGFSDFDALQNAINNAHIFRFISKPWHDGELLSAVEQALAHRAALLETRRLADIVLRQEAEINRQQHELERLEKEHPGITRVHRGNDGSILLDGTGQE